MLDTELAAMDAALDKLRPVIDAVVDEVRVQLENIVVAALSRKLTGQVRAGKLGERKRCRVCGLPGARNMAALAPNHSREEHERLRIKPQNVQSGAERVPFGAQRSTTPRRLQRA